MTFSCTPDRLCLTQSLTTETDRLAFELAKNMKTTQCPSDELIIAFAAGQLIEEVSENVAAHFDQCDQCVERLQTLDPDADELGNLIRKAGGVSVLSNEGLVAEAQNVPAETVKRGDTKNNSRKKDKTPELLPEKLSNRYDVLGEIGHGGIGVVALARDVDLGRELAIKLLREKHRQHDEIVQRFREEARIIGQLQHPGIVPVYEMGQSSDGRPFFSMKLVNGQTLDEVINEFGTHTKHRRRMLNIMLSVCQTVAYAHSKGVVHRDLKPINIMVGEFGEVQVLDWGLAKLLVGDNALQSENIESASVSANARTNERSSSSTVNSLDGTVIGTPAYMPPEQAQGLVEKTGKQSDVFSLGAILLEILTGQPPYGGVSTQEQLCAAESADMQSSLDRLEGESIDEELKSIVRRCLEREFENRPADAGAVAIALEGYLQSVEARLQQAQITAAAAESKAKQETKTRRVTVALIGFVAVTLLVTGYFWFRYQENRRIETADVNQRVNAALVDARRVLDVAEIDPMNAKDLARGQAASRLAESISQSPLVGPELLEQVENVSQRYADVSQGRELLIEFDRLRRGPVGSETKNAGFTYFDWSAIDSGYADLLKRMGIDLQSTDVQGTVSILKSQPAYLQQEIINGVDSWCNRINNEQRNKFWVDVLNQVDPSQMRRQLRDQNHLRRARGLEMQPLDSFRPDASSESMVIATAAIFTSSGNFEEAIDIFEQSLPYFPTSYWIHREFARNLIYAESDRVNDVVTHFSIALACRPDNAMAKLELLGGLNYAKEFEDALIIGESLLQELDHAPAKARTFRLMANCSKQLGDLDGAAEYYEKAIAQSDDQSFTHETLAKIYLDSGLNREFERECRVVIKQNPQEAVWRFNLGNSLLRQRKYRRAIEAYSDCLKLDPGFVQAIINLGQAKTELGEFAEARKLFESIVSDYENSRWVSSAKMEIARTTRLESLQKNIVDAKPDALDFASARHQLEMARCCDKIGKHQLACTLYQDLLGQPGNKLLAQNNALHFFAARAALEFAFDDSTSELESAEYLAIAYENIKTEFEIRKTMIEQNPEFHRPFALMLRQWQDDPVFENVKTGKMLETLDSETRQRWESFWNDVQTTFEDAWKQGG